jgi:outer membrane protein TolC
MRRAPAALLVLAAAGCSADNYRKDADLEVGEIIRSKEERLFGSASGFTIEQAEDILRAQLVAELAAHHEAKRAQLLREVLPQETAVAEGGSGSDGGSTAAIAAVQADLAARLSDIERRHAVELVPFAVTDPPLLARKVLTLTEALEIAAENSRDFQRQKESVYLSALDVTLQRYLFEARFGVTSSYDWSSRPGDPRQRDGTLSTDFSLRQQLASGGLVVFSFGHDLLRRFTGVEFTNGDRSDTSSLFDLSFSQPLLRGAGKSIVQEPLVRSEREAVYSLREFERFRQEFAVRVASEYYRILQQVDQIDNARRSYLQFIDAREQSEALAERGRRSQIQLDQAVSSELSARNSWITAQRSYQDAIDNFKLTLGLPMEADLGLDAAELARLREQGLAPVLISETRAAHVALERRLDHVNEVERFEDAQRSVNVAADDLRAALDLSGGVNVPFGKDTAFDIDSNGTWRAGATLDLPVDKLQERNAYRRALIQQDVQGRTLTLSEDQVRQDVRDALRRLAQLRETHRIAVESVEVAERRVQSTSLTLRMGRIQIRDALDATDALNRARNQLTQSLVDHEVARLELWRDMGLLAVGGGGMVLPELPPLRLHDDDGETGAGTAGASATEEGAKEAGAASEESSGQ